MNFAADVLIQSGKFFNQIMLLKFMAVHIDSMCWVVNENLFFGNDI